VSHLTFRILLINTGAIANFLSFKNCHGLLWPPFGVIFGMQVQMKFPTRVLGARRYFSLGLIVVSV
ncbi:hypothetical protein KI387_002857, partial [Taxus chinensis]